MPSSQFEDFLDVVDAFGPVQAEQRLRRFGVPEETLGELVEMFKEHVGTVRESTGPVYTQSGGRMTWYTGPRPSDRCWPPLEQTLRSEWDDDSVQLLDDASTRIVSLLDHPKSHEFTTKGLALGYVQAGKTTNYTAVIAKAADRGYRFFIVLSGIHNELRRQTQSRLVGQLVEPNKSFWHQLTNEDHDFVPPANAQSFFSTYSNQAVLCVVKKNAQVLPKLITWLREAGLALNGVAAMVIDDEADQAAVATRTINPMLLDLLDSLPRVAYIGYTATPFANLLIDPAANDLYPEHFIVDLKKPPKYFGPEVIFGREALDGEDPTEIDDGYNMVRQVPDTEVGDVRPLSKKHIDGFAPDLNGEIRQAVRWFWLATAARRVRATGTPHSTMLIHTSVNVAVHESFKAPLSQMRSDTLRRWKEEDPRLIDALRHQWEAEAAAVPAEEFGRSPVSFGELADHLTDVLTDTRIILDNSNSPDRLDYRAGPQVAIAVGGNTLSRGLTLEGLISSYFVRSATAYDTLLQMGRWFGFRIGYEELPRIWMTEELKLWFRHLAVVEAEIRRDAARYMAEDLTPKTFAIRIRNHPSLNITSAAKMASAALTSGAYGGMRVQSHYFRTNDSKWLADNTGAARRLVASAFEQGQQDDGRLIWRDLPADTIFEFLGSYSMHELSADKNPKLIENYIKERNKKDALRLWNLAVVDNGEGSDLFNFGNGIEVPTIVRSRLKDTPDEAADIKTLMSRRDAALDLRQTLPPRASEDKIRAARMEELPRHGLVVLYGIDRISPPDPNKKKQYREELNAHANPVGVGFVFPQPPHGDLDAVAYYQADLSRIVQPGPGDIEEEDMTGLDHE